MATRIFACLHSPTPYHLTVCSLAVWYKEVKNADWKNPAELKALFPDADLIGDKVVFNIALNRYRLIAWVAYRAHKVFVQAIFTHKEYDRENWK
jgi:mRNA interferase HigB